MYNYQRISRNHSTTAFRLHNDRLGGYRFDAELDTGIAMDWIDVNEKLPEVGIDSVYGSAWVLVSYVFDGKHYNTLGKYIKTPTPYWIDVHRDKLEKITHWMQLPEPPSVFGGVDPFEMDLLTKV